MYRLFLLLSVMLLCVVCLFTQASLIAIAVGALALGFLFPVWRRGGFWFAFLGAALVWGAYAGYVHIESEGRLGDRLAVTFGVATGWVLVMLTALWGGITAGLGGLTGAALRIALRGGKK
jgi:hypothetical protein